MKGTTATALAWHRGRRQHIASGTGGPFNPLAPQTVQTVRQAEPLHEITPYRPLPLQQPHELQQTAPLGLWVPRRPPHVAPAHLRMADGPGCPTAASRANQVGRQRPVLTVFPELEEAARAALKQAVWAGGARQSAEGEVHGSWVHLTRGPLPRENKTVSGSVVPEREISRHAMCEPRCSGEPPCDLWRVGRHGMLKRLCTELCRGRVPSDPPGAALY